MERATQEGYITHRSKHKKINMHQPSWSNASSITQPFWLWSYEHGESYTGWLYHTHRSIHQKSIMYQPSWSYAASLTQPSWRWSYQHGKRYARWLHHTLINARKDDHASTFMIRVKHNPIILALESSTWKELHKMVTSHTDQYRKRLSCINLHGHKHQA